MNLIFFILLIGPLVFAHELGHFLVAKAFNIKVVKFSLGFGPVLIGRRVGETFYQIASVPLGGFVRFHGDDPTENIDDKDRERSWPETARWKRAAVVVSGPLMSLIFPIFCYFAVFVFVDELRPATIGQVIHGTPADRAGLKAGDIIREIDGTKIHGFVDLQREINSSPEQDLEVRLQRGDEEITVKLRPARIIQMRFRALDIKEELGQIGIHNVFPAPVVALIPGETVARRAGLETFDLITKLGDETVRRWIDAETTVEKVSPGTTLGVSYLRSEKVRWPFADVVLQSPAQTTFTLAEDEGTLEAMGLELSSTHLSYVIEGMPGEKAGLRVGDKIVSVDGSQVHIWEQFKDKLTLAPTESHVVTVIRGDGEHTFTLQPERYIHTDTYAGEQELYREPEVGVYRVGVLGDLVPNPNRISRAGVEAVRLTYEMIKLNAIGILRLFQGRVSLNTVGGPIMMWKLAGTAGSQGSESFLRLLALISIMLGLVNLLPIPVLDGGQLVLLAIEGIRRRSLTLKAREIIQITGLVLLLILMVFAFQNDIRRFWDWEDFVGLFQ